MRLRILVGLVISGIFIFLAFRKVDFHEMWTTLIQANYLWLVPALIFMFVSHWLRAIRWRYFLDHIKPVKTHPLFSALMIGYAANNVFPLRLGEVLRAYAIGRSEGISKSSALATVIVERLIDVLSLLAILAVTVLLISQRPGIASHDDIVLIKNSGYIIFAITMALIVLLIFLMEKTEATIRVIGWLVLRVPSAVFRRLSTVLKRLFGRSKFEATMEAPVKLFLVHLPEKVFESIQKIVRSFLQGFMVFKRSEHYFTVIMFSIAIWLLYAGVIYVAFFAFDFDTKYNLNIFASLVVLVTVSIGIMIPSSPGFVGTYHWFCMVSLAFFKVSQSEALGFAVISHAVNFLPVTVVGLIYFWKENLRLSVAMQEQELAGSDGVQPEGVEKATARSKSI